MCNSRSDPVREERHLVQLEQQRVMGILITPVNGDNPRLRELPARGTPVALVDRASREGHCSVTVDDRLGGWLAGQHLIGRGHRRIAFLGGPLTTPQLGDRHAGIAAAVAETTGVTLETLESAGSHAHAGRALGEVIVARPRRCRAPPPAALLPAPPGGTGLQPPSGAVNESFTQKAVCPLRSTRNTRTIGQTPSPSNSSASPSSAGPCSTSRATPRPRSREDRTLRPRLRSPALPHHLRQGHRLGPLPRRPARPPEEAP
ncbi:type 1 periplasmic-binding domain-containing protein [Streptomyces litchfieldiae]|uniref:hypothetical protein n=1 Tax=Streptomyces litchfieldiae TaxID=3075543 RepID=UPI00374E15F1